MTFHPALTAKLAAAAALLGSTIAAPAESAPESAVVAAASVAPAEAISAPHRPAQATLFKTAAEAASFKPTPLGPHRLPRAKSCRLPHMNPARDVRLLSRAGYRDVTFRGRRAHAARCSQFLYFSACRGATQYQVIVRYVNGRRSTVTMRAGQCTHRNSPQGRAA